MLRFLFTVLARPLFTNWILNSVFPCSGWPHILESLNKSLCVQCTRPYQTRQETKKTRLHSKCAAGRPSIGQQRQTCIPTFFFTSLLIPPTVIRTIKFFINNKCIKHIRFSACINNHIYIYIYRQQIYLEINKTYKLDYISICVSLLTQQEIATHLTYYYYFLFLTSHYWHASLTLTHTSRINNNNNNRGGKLCASTNTKHT